MTAMTCPSSARTIFDTLAQAFTRPTAARMGALALVAILTVGRRTLTHIIITSAGMLAAHFTTYYRLFSRPAWSTWTLSHLLARLVVDLIPAGKPVVVAADDTVTEHPGKNVYGKGKHRDAPRSSASMVKWIWGHKWVVLVIVLPIPYVSRPWALPVLMALYRSPAQSKAEGRRHKTPSDIARTLMRRLMTWFPGRKFILLGDGGFSSHQMARFARRFHKQLTFVGKFYPNAGLYDPPPVYSGNGRPRVKGGKRLKPKEWVEQASRRYTATVDWYGGGKRKVSLVGGEGQWYKRGLGLAAVRWVHVRDLDGTHREEYFFSTDPDMSLPQIVSLYTRRWNIETMFQEVRQHVGVGSTRRWCKKAVLRAEPWLFGLYTVIVLIYVEHLRTNEPRVSSYPWLIKSEPTFADAIAEVRTLIWLETVFAHPVFTAGVGKLPPKIQQAWINWCVHAA